MKFYHYFSLFSLLTVKILAVNNNNQCRQSAEPYSDCIANINGNDFDKMCKAYTNERCQQLFKSPSNILKGCDKEFIEMTTSVFSDIYNILKFTCTKDENGNYCPLSGIIQQTKTSPDSFKNKKFSDIFGKLDSSCSSKSCTNISLLYLNSIKSMASSEDEVKDINNLISHLSSCNNNNNNNSNGSTAGTSSTSSTGSTSTSSGNADGNGQTIQEEDEFDVNMAPIGDNIDFDLNQNQNQTPVDNNNVNGQSIQIPSSSVSKYILSYTILALTLTINLYLFN